MRFSLAQLIRRRSNPRRSQIPLREIVPPSTLATSLYRAVYLPIIQAWERALPRTLTQYERTLAQMTTDSPASIEAEVAATESELQRLLLELTPRLREWAVRVERFVRGKFVANVLSASSIDLSTLLGPSDVSDTVEASIAWNTSLVKDVSEQVRQRIANAVFAGVQQRKPARDVAKEIREAVGMGRQRSIRIASDQATKLTSRLDQARQEQAGIEKFRWRHSGKAHPRVHHQARNGKEYPWRGNDLGGDLPGVAPYCGCRAQALVSLE